MSDEVDSGSAMRTLLQGIDSAKWTEASPDWLRSYLGSKPTSRRMSVHRPAIGVTRFQVTAQFQEDPNNPGHQVPHWTGKVELEPGLKAVIKDLPEWQREHRSRKVSLAFTRGQAFELNRRATNVRLNMDKLKQMQLTDDMSRMTAEVQAEAFLKYSTVDPVWINKYIKEHEDSSVQRGTKWPVLGDASVHRATWQKILDIHRSRCEDVLDGKMFGMSPNFALNMGSRQRYNGDPVEQFPEDWIHAGAIERSRVVLFHEALSTHFAFMPKENKPKYYKDTVMNALDLMELDLPARYVCPLWDGGDVYHYAADAFQGGSPVIIGLGDDYNYIDESGQLHAIDGSTWDSNAGVINGPGHHWMTTRFGGHNSVPSGVIKTTTDDQIAMANTIAKLEAKAGRRVDQMDGDNQYLLDGIAGFEQADADFKFILGLTYNLPDGPDYPGICGIKLMEDSADTFRPLIEGRTLDLKRTDDPNALLSHQSAFYGRSIDNDSLLSLMGKVDAEDWISPGVLIRREIEFHGEELE